MNLRSSTAFVALATTLMLSACSDNERDYRTYREVTNRSPLPHHTLAPTTPPADQATPPMSGSASTMAPLPDGMNQPSARLSWTAPDGWVEQPGSGVRLATFVVDGADCAIFTFPGDVGGTEANIRRWWGQLNAGSIGDDALRAFIDAAPSFVSDGGLNGRFYDFLQILPESAGTATLVSTLDLGEHTAFIKLTGPRAVVRDHLEQFMQLSRSIYPGGQSI